MSLFTQLSHKKSRNWYSNCL